MALRDFALSVGINGYPGLRSLTGAEPDAVAFHAWAQAQGIQPPYAKLIVSSDFTPPATQAADACPAAHHIHAFFTFIQAQANANNDSNLGLVAGRRLYLYFAGHGFSPSIDTSGILLANADGDFLHNLSPKAWADRFYENGLFEEVLLFQDACRESFLDAELTPPNLKRSRADRMEERKRFYAFAARTPLLALEKPIANGGVRGVFSATLMAGLEGAARDPHTGLITAQDLKRYLRENVKARLSPAELDNQDIAKQPEVFDLDPDLVIVGPPAGRAEVKTFPVAVVLPAGQGARILNHAREVVAETPPGPSPWRTALPLGLYEAVIPGVPSRLFRVAGAVGPDGHDEVAHVG